MPRPVVDFELDPAVVPIPDDIESNADEWLYSHRRDTGPLDLDVTGAALVAEARHESD